MNPRDLMAGIGFLALVAGIWLTFGQGPAVIAAGALLIAFAVVWAFAVVPNR